MNDKEKLNRALRTLQPKKEGLMSVYDRLEGVDRSNDFTRLSEEEYENLCSELEQDN